MSSCFNKEMSKRERPRVLLRADAGSSIGFGHYVRTCALGGYLCEDFECILVSRNPDLGLPSDYQRELATSSGLTIMEVAAKSRENFDPAFLDLIEADDIVVLDNYYYDTPYMTEVKSRCRALVCIDDMHDRHFPADMVMTFCPLTREQFSMKPEAKFVGGMEWSFLRAPFLKPPMQRNYTGQTPKHIALAMGGADPLGLTNKIVRLLHKIDASLQIDVLAGQTVKIDFEEDARLRVHRQASAEEIADMFDRCDLGIFPASTVCVEAFSRELPVAAGFFVDNQEEIYAYGVKHGWFTPLGDLTKSDDMLMPLLQKALATSLSPAPAFDFAARRRDIVNLFRKL